MKKDKSVILNGIIIVVLVALGVAEYVELEMCFDMPQVMIVAPIVGALSVVLCKKFWFMVPIGTVVLSSIYQVIAGYKNALEFLDRSSAGIFDVIMRNLLVVLFFMALGMGAGALIRGFMKNKRSFTGIIKLVAALVIIFVPYEVLYVNPLYPIVSRLEYGSAARWMYEEQAGDESHVMSVLTYFDMNRNRYEALVTMADGTIHALYPDKTGKITDK